MIQEGGAAYSRVSFPPSRWSGLGGPCAAPSVLIPAVPGTDSKGVGTEKNRELGQGRSEYSPAQRRPGPLVTRLPTHWWPALQTHPFRPSA